MANDIDIDRGEDFSTRIDDLVASALEDQSREKQLLTDTVAAANVALSSAREELASIRELIEQRDRAVVDAIEARLSGVGTELTLNSLADAMDELVRRKPADEAVGVLLAQLEALKSQVANLDKSVSVVDPWKPAAEVQRSLQEKLDELSSNFLSQLSGLTDTIYRSGSALQKEMNSEVVPRLDALAETSSAGLRSTRDEVIQGVTGAIAADLASVRDEVIQRIGYSTTVQLRLVRDELIQGISAPMAAELEKARDDVIQRIGDSTTVQLGLVRDELIQGISAPMAAELEKTRDEVTHSLASAKAEQSSTLEVFGIEAKELLQRAMARLSDRLVKHQSEMTEVLAGLLEPYEHELQEFVEGIRRTNLRIRKTDGQLDELRQALVAQVAHREMTLDKLREEVVADIVAQISDGLENPERKRMVEGLRESRARKQDKRDAERYRKLSMSGNVDKEPDLAESPPMPVSEPVKPPAEEPAIPPPTETLPTPPAAQTPPAARRSGATGKPAAKRPAQPVPSKQAKTPARAEPARRSRAR